MIYALYIFAGLAAILHVFIFYLETIAWESPLAKKTFGLSDEAVGQTKEMAANQGVYNLLLAFVTFAGIGVALSNTDALNTGVSLILAGCGSMLAAAVYLFVSSNKKAAAIKQMAFPLVAAVLAAIVLL